MKTLNQTLNLSEYIGILQDNDLLSQIHKLYKVIYKKISNNKKIFLAGNGGSASISNHAVIDFLKNFKTHNDVSKKLFFSLSSNNEVITAIANDYGYENIFSFQLSRYSNDKDLLILISSSGNSPNIIKAAKYAKKNGLDLFSLVGFDGGKLKKLSDQYIHIKSDKYGTVEDVHQIIIHSVISLSQQY